MFETENTSSCLANPLPMDRNPQTAASFKDNSSGAVDVLAICLTAEHCVHLKMYSMHSPILMFLKLHISTIDALSSVIRHLCNLFG